MAEAFISARYYYTNIFVWFSFVNVYTCVYKSLHTQLLIYLFFLRESHYVVHLA